MFKRGYGYHFTLHESKDIMYLRPTKGAIAKAFLPVLVMNGVLFAVLHSMSEKADAEINDLIKEFDENED